MTINETYIIGDEGSGSSASNTFTSIDNTVDITISGTNVDLSVATADTNTFTSEDNSVDITISGSNIDFSVATASTSTITSEDNSVAITVSGSNFNLSVITTDSIISGSTEPITSGGVYDGFINKEDISNKISVISGSSLTEYPNEKAIVDYVAVAVSAVTYLTEYTYSGLMNLVNNNELVVGRKYILTDYQTKYIINGSDSSTRQQIHGMVGAAGPYTQFGNVPSTIASNGDIITCVFAPIGATIVTGQTFTIVAYFNASYLLLSPTVYNLANIGARFRFEKQRYANVPNNITIDDVNAKPVIKPTGVLNTEVHDNLPYMSMIGSENPSPIIERIVLTAIDANRFSHNAESLTFIGDSLEYDFNNNIINDDNGNFKANKNGTILKRINVDETISTNNDWRVQRYRRYRMDDANWNNYTLRKELSGLSGTSGTTIYKIGAINYCTNTNPTISLNHRYVISEPFISNFYTDFAKTVNNPFLSGVTTAPGFVVGERMPTNEHVSEYSCNISLPLSGFSGTSLAKDFHIIPISSGSPTSITTFFNVQNISNVVFLDNTQKYGLSSSIYVDSRNGSITNSSFMSGFPLINYNRIDKLTTLDYFGITNYNRISNVNLLGYGMTVNKGVLLNSTIGQGEVGGGTNEYAEFYFGDNTFVIDSIFGSIRFDTYFFNDFVANKSIMLNNVGSNNKIYGNMYLTLYKNANGMYGSEVKINTYVNQIPSKGFYGHIYDFNLNLSDKILDNFTTEHNLIYKNISGGTINIVTVSIPS